MIQVLVVDDQPGDHIYWVITLKGSDLWYNFWRR